MEPYVDIYIGGKRIDPKSIIDLPLNITYKLEDKRDFQSKSGSAALSITIPATDNNSVISNSFHNPSIEDLTSDGSFKGIRNSRIVVAGNEFLVGKAFQKAARHTDRPISYEYDFYGNNSDWILDLKDTTLYDVLKAVNFIFTKEHIIDSWNFDGRNEAMPYVFAPVRYGNPMETYIDGTTGQETVDLNMTPEYMKPSLSKYWILYKAFKSLGYRIQSDFFDTDYFRRQVMPWTWGSFLNSDGTKLDSLKFLAKSTETLVLHNVNYTGNPDMHVTNDSTNGGYDNSNTYEYVSGNTMQWTYLTAPAFNFGLLQATFHINVWFDGLVRKNSDIEVRVQWFKNGVRINNGNDNGNGTLLMELNAPSVGLRTFTGPLEDWFTINVNQGDIITAKLYVHTFKSSLGTVRLDLAVDEFNIDYFRTPLGGTINFDNFLALKKWKFLDFLGGIVDEFDLTLNTDTRTKTIYIEPTHPYSLVNDQSIKSGGYFNGNTLDWSGKQDLRPESSLEPFTDSERELLFQYKDDGNDGTLKKTQDRTNSRVGQAKYVLPNRFTAGQREIENRFFAPTMHYEVKQWIFDLSESPQMVIMAPENISNLSSGEAQNTFVPKSCYYKGLTTAYKWMFDSEITHPYPYMFAVNYKPGGENDPILSYSDEMIGTVKAKGLLRRFFLQRLAIMANGPYYNTYFRLDNNDVMNFLHREFILCQGQKWEIIQIDYSTVKGQSAKVLMRKWVPING